MSQQNVIDRFSAMSFSIGSIKGIPIRVHYFLPLITVITTFSTYPYGGMAMLTYFIVIGPILFCTILIHELGHSWATRRVGGEVHSILMWPLGGLAFCGHAGDPKDDLFIAAAGPLTHLPGMLFWFLILLAASTGNACLTCLDYDDVGKAIIIISFWMNFFLMLFNLCLPAYPLDGGRILVAIMLIHGFAVETTAKTAVAISAVASVGIAVWGVLPPFSLTTLLVGAWVGYAAYQLYQSIQAGTIASHPMFVFTANANSSGSASAGGAGAAGAGGGLGGFFSTKENPLFNFLSGGRRGANLNEPLNSGTPSSSPPPPQTAAQV